MTLQHNEFVHIKYDYSILFRFSSLDSICTSDELKAGLGKTFKWGVVTNSSSSETIKLKHGKNVSSK